MTKVAIFNDVGREIDRDRLQRSIALSLPSFREKYLQDYSNEEMQEFNNALSDIINSIGSGNVASRTAARELVFSDGVTRGNTSDPNSPYGVAANLVNRVIDSMPTYYTTTTPAPLKANNNNNNSSTTTSAPKDGFQKLQEKQYKTLEALASKVADWDETNTDESKFTYSDSMINNKVLDIDKWINNEFSNNGKQDATTYFKTNTLPDVFKIIIEEGKTNFNNLTKKTINLPHLGGKTETLANYIYSRLITLMHPERKYTPGNVIYDSTGLKVLIPGSVDTNTGVGIIYDFQTMSLIKRFIGNRGDADQLDNSIYNGYLVSKGLGQSGNSSQEEQESEQQQEQQQQEEQQEQTQGQVKSNALGGILMLDEFLSGRPVRFQSGGQIHNTFTTTPPPHQKKNTGFYSSKY